jgi:hypothetical protein
MTKIPSCFIADRQASFELIGRHAFLGFNHKIDSEKPLPKGKMGIMEDSTSRNREIIMTRIAVILITVFYVAYLFRFATRAFNSLRPFQSFKGLATVLFVAVLFNEVDQISIHKRFSL